MNYCPNHCLLSFNRDLSFKHCVWTLIVQSIGSPFRLIPFFCSHMFLPSKPRKKSLGQKNKILIHDMTFETGHVFCRRQFTSGFPFQLPTIDAAPFISVPSREGEVTALNIFCTRVTMYQPEHRSMATRLGRVNFLGAKLFFLSL
jgi:hypothetical protein